MKGLLAFLAGIVVACAITFMLLPFIVPTSVVRDAVAQQVEAWTGQRLTFAGSSELSVFPNLHINMRDVSLTPANGASEAGLLAVEMLSGRIQLLPLIFGNVQIDEFSLTRPRLTLRVDPRGVPNWNMAAKAGEGAAPAPKPAALSVAGPAGGQPAALSDIRIGVFSITDGQIKYIDERGGRIAEVTGINSSLAWPALSQPLSGSGSLVWNGEVVKFEGSVSDALRLVTGGTAGAVTLNMSSSRLAMQLAGSASTLPDMAFNGSMEASIPSMRALARWLDIALPDGPGLDNFRLNSKFMASGTKLSFSQASLSMDGNAAEGALVVKITDGRPAIQATLAFATLNLNPYLQQAPAAEQAAPAAPAPTAVSRAAQAGTTDKTEGGWSTRPIDFKALRSADADIRLSAQKIQARDFDLGGGAAALNLMGGRLKANIAELTAYGGRISAMLSLDGSGNVPSGALNLKSSGLALQPFLRDTMSFHRLSGTGDLAVDVASQGAHQAAMLSALRGKVAINAANGQISGIDISAALENVRKGQLTGLSQAGTGSTVFERLHAGFDIASGIARTQDMLLESQKVKITGEGQISLPARNLDIRIRGALLTSPGADGKPGVAMEIPLIVRGDWDSPLIYPDPEALLNSPAVKQTIEETVDVLNKDGVKGVERMLKDGGLNSVLDRLRGK